MTAKKDTPKSNADVKKKTKTKKEDKKEGSVK